MFKWIFNKIKTYGVGAAIEALDNLERPLGEKIDASIKEFNKLDGYGIAKMVIDWIQELLRAYFKLPETQKK